MYLTLTSLSVLVGTIECASYQRYGDTTYRYPTSTVSYNNQYRTASYGNDIASFPEVTRYPNYSPGAYSPGYSYSPGNSGYSTSRYPYSTTGYNSYNNNGYSTNAYNNGYSPNGYNNGYSTNGYNNGYSTNGYNTLYGGGSNNLNYNQGYNTLGRYGEGYGSTSMQGYGRSGLPGGYGGAGLQGYGGTGLQGYGSNGLQGGYSSFDTYGRDIGTCVNRTPQTGIWVDSLMGMWYGVEVIQHLGGDSRVDHARTCIVVHIAEPRDRPSTENQVYHVQHINAKFRQEYRHLRLLWDEGGHTVEYALFFKNDSAGYWHVFDGQNGSLTNLNYQQFSGTVQVLKAVNDHLVLNFCQEGGMNGRPAQLYSVLLSRNPGDLSHWEIDSVHNLLQTKQLSVASRRMVCGSSGADGLLHSMVLSFLTCLLACVLSIA